MANSPTPADFAHLHVLSMNMAGRFTGREIRNFGQNVLRHILVEKQIALFLGQQISFKPSLPEGYEYVGNNKSFLCYNKHLLKVSDERQYRHFLRDLHFRGHLPHHYLPEKNYVVMKMRYRNKPWSEFIALSWMTDERQTKVKYVAQLRKVLYYASQLAEAEEMPVIVGGTFRMATVDIENEMDYDFGCYSYTPTTPRRKIRLSNTFLCSSPMLMDGVKPLVCSKLEFRFERSVKWLNPEDAFYWDPIMGEMLLPIETPKSTEEKNQVDGKVEDQPSSSSQTRPITGISSKHLLVSANTPLSGRSLGLTLPMAPVLPTPQENVAPPPSPEGDECRSLSDSVGLSNSACHLSVIDEVSSEIERQDSFVSSDSDTIRTSGSYPVSPVEAGPNGRSIDDIVSKEETEKEEKIFELLETMMNDKNSTFYRGDAEKENGSEADPTLVKIIQKNELSSLVELSTSDKSQLDGPAVAINGQQEPLPNEVAQTNGLTVSPCRMTASFSDLSLSGECKAGVLKRAPSCQELYDEELVANSTTCYMS